MLGTMTKAPDDVLDYDVDYGQWLPLDDRIVAATAAIEGLADASTIVVQGHEYADRSVKVWLAGGNAGDIATVHVTAVTHAGRTKEACFRIRVKDCN